MKSIKIMGLCLVAAFLVSAVAVATASATTPTFLFPGGGSKPQFSSTSGAGTLVAKVGPNTAEVTCTSDRDSGEDVPGTDRVKNVLVIFDGCRAKLPGTTETVPCTSAGLTTELIKTNQLEGDLGYISQTSSPREVGLVLKPQPPEELFAEFTCKNTAGTINMKIKVKGEIIGKITPVNTPVKVGESFVLEYGKGTESWEQKYQSLTVLGELKDALLLLVKVGTEENYEFGGLSTTDKVFPLETVEISA